MFVISFCVAVHTSRAAPRTAQPRIPGGVRPCNLCCLCHFDASLYFSLPVNTGCGRVAWIIEVDLFRNPKDVESAADREVNDCDQRHLARHTADRAGGHATQVLCCPGWVIAWPLSCWTKWWNLA